MQVTVSWEAQTSFSSITYSHSSWAVPCQLRGAVSVSPVCPEPTQSSPLSQSCMEHEEAFGAALSQSDQNTSSTCYPGGDAVQFIAPLGWIETSLCHADWGQPTCWGTSSQSFLFNNTLALHDPAFVTADEDRLKIYPGNSLFWHSLLFARMIS